MRGLPDSHRHVLAVARRLSANLAEAISEIGPLSPEPAPQIDVAARLCVEVVNQQLSVHAARAIWSRIEAASAGLDLTPRDLFIPGRETLLRTCGLSANKVRALQAIRVAEEAGLLDATLATRPHRERSAILCRIKGVGPWTADMIGIFHYGDPDIWPVGDVAAVGCLRRLTGCDDTQAYAAAFAPHRSLLARILWRIKDSARDASSAATRTPSA